MSLFDEPVSAHLGEDAVLWVGVVEERKSERAGGMEQAYTLTQAIVVNAKGRVGLAPIQELTADWRWVPDRAPYREGLVTGPGWIDLEELENKVPEAKPPAGIGEALIEALTKDEPAKPGGPVEGRDFIVGSDGTKYDPSTNLPIDE